VYVTHDSGYNITAALDEEGEVIERYTYAAYGEQTVYGETYSQKLEESQIDMDLGWQGGEYTEHGRLIAFRKRIENWWLGVWMGNDPKGFVNGGNTLQYEVGNPYAGVDPTGTETIPASSLSSIRQFAYTPEYYTALNDIAQRLWDDYNANKGKRGENYSYLTQQYDNLIKYPENYPLARSSNRTIPEIIIPPDWMENWEGFLKDNSRLMETTQLYIPSSNSLLAYLNLGGISMEAPGRTKNELKQMFIKDLGGSIQMPYNGPVMTAMSESEAEWSRYLGKLSERSSYDSNAAIQLTLLSPNSSSYSTFMATSTILNDLGIGLHFANHTSTIPQLGIIPETAAESGANPILGLKRVGSALKTDPYHAFPDIIDNFASSATKTQLPNATLYQVEGSLNSTAGRFEWIVQDGNVTHRLFVPGGTLNGVPIKP
jgi:RHS repeat-associated protein